MKIFKFVLNTVPRPYLIKLSYLVSPILAFWLKGDRYTDPIDGKSFKRFLSYGYGTQRPNVLSPSTLSLERHRLLWLYLKNETGFFTKPLKVLHMAPEQCFLSLFKKNQFDIILCNHVLEHIEDDARAMKELFRVMKSGGMGIFQIPQDITRETSYEDDTIQTPEDRAQHFGQYDHVRIYGRDYFDRLRAAGFKVEEVDYSKTLPDELVEKYCLAKGEILPVCFKP